MKILKTFFSLGVCGSLLVIQACTPDLDAIERDLLGAWQPEILASDHYDIDRCLSISKEGGENYMSFFRHSVLNDKTKAAKEESVGAQSASELNAADISAKLKASADIAIAELPESTVQMTEGEWILTRGKRFAVRGGHVVSADQFRIPKDGKRRIYDMLAIIESVDNNEMIIHIDATRGNKKFKRHVYKRVENCDSYKAMVDELPLGELDHEEQLRKRMTGETDQQEF